MSFRSRGSFYRRPFRSDSGNRFHRSGRTRPFNEGRNYDSGGRYNSFRDSQDAWFDRDAGGSKTDRRSTDGDKYSNSRRYSESHGRDDSYHRKYRGDSSSYKRSYDDASDEHRAGHSFKFESGFKRSPRNSDAFEYSELDDFHSPSSYPYRSRSGSSRISSFRAAGFRRSVFRRPYGTTFIRGRGIRSRKFGSRVPSVPLHKLKLIQKLRAKNAARGEKFSSDDDKESCESEDKAEYSEEEQDDQVSDENKMDTTSNEKKEESTKKRAATESPTIRKKMKTQESKNDDELTAGSENDTKKTTQVSNKLLLLKCPHCKNEYKTYAYYAHHLRGPEHLEFVTKRILKIKHNLFKIRNEQRKKQWELDAQDGSTRRSYCDVCQLQYKQPRILHYSSYFHKHISKLLQPRCRVCDITFHKPSMYIYHTSSVNHVKRALYLARRTDAVKKKNAEEPDEQFITLDSIGSVDDGAGGDSQNVVEEVTDNDEPEEESKADSTKREKKSGEGKEVSEIYSISKEFAKPVTLYYCELCECCLPFKPKKPADYVLRLHCRDRYHVRNVMRAKIREELAAAKQTKQDVVEDEEKWSVIEPPAGDNKESADTSADERDSNTSLDDEDNAEVEYHEQ